MNQQLAEIPLNQIHTISNYRKTFRDKSLNELAASIKANGILEPIIVRPKGKHYEIVAGERRVRASLLAGLVTIPAVIRDVSESDFLRLQIIENVQRENVPFMEEAYAIKKLRDDLSLDLDEIVKIIGKSQAYVYYKLRLCEMSDEARSIAEKGWISKSVAWEIAKLPDKDQQTQAATATARPSASKLVSVSGVKNYIRDNILENSSGSLRKKRVASGSRASSYAQNWKYYLVRLTAEQFSRFKDICRGRTETGVLAEAVDLVMRRENETELADAMEA